MTTEEHVRRMIADLAIKNCSLMAQLDEAVAEIDGLKAEIAELKKQSGDGN